jgi:hypothetical protein
MKTKILLTTLSSFVILHSSLPASAATTIDAATKSAYAANLGWMDWRGDTNNGAVIGDYVCSGYIYSANVGWINLGSGSPSDRIRYHNFFSFDFGVNHDGAGNLRGYAYGANIGWINFEDTGAPSVDLITGKMSGYAWSANCGWISLSNSAAYVQTDSFDPGVDTDGDGLPDAWEWSYFGTLSQNANGNPDGDGMSNAQEYLAGTDPNNANSNLRITRQTFSLGGTNATLQWTSVTNRVYHIGKTTSLSAPAWVESPALAPDIDTTTTRAFADTNAPMRFYRIRAARPLTP